MTASAGSTRQGAYGRSARSLLFLLAVLAINYTLSRPSPVDMLFSLALVTTIFCNQSFTHNSVTYLILALLWTAGLFISSIKLLDDEEIELHVVKICYAVSISICACLVATHWTPKSLRRFLQVWILAAMVAATLGIIGFAGNIEDLIWDGRAKAFLDDPNMYGAFLLPGAFACIYFLSLGRKVALYVFCLICIAGGVLFSFSRVAITALFILGSFVLWVNNPGRVLNALKWIAVFLVVVLLLGAIGSLFVDGFQEKVADRFTFAKEYDLGEQGRLNRYVTSIGLMLANPGGMGALQFQRAFPEPIHNIWLSSFMNYGWLAGFAWTYIILFGIVLSVRNYLITRDRICLTLMCCWLGILMCALLHEAERWRHLWLFCGLIWGVNYRNWGLSSAPARRLAQRIVSQRRGGFAEDPA